jgi:cytidylate kinase
VKAALKLVDLTVSYDRHPAVHHLSAEIPAAEMTAIVGPNGAGKSTLLKAMLGLAPHVEGRIECAARRIAYLPQQAEIDRSFPIPVLDTVLLSSPDIRTAEVSDGASRVATDPAVRAARVERQRELMADGDWVAEGRDIGTVVAPDAAVKVFLTADPAERARRRAAELGADPEVVLRDQTLRDEQDRNREHSPLQPAPGAVEVDTTGLSLDQVVEKVAALVLEAG